MKILEIDYDYYYYPDGITCIKDFIDYANKHYSSFIELKQFETENCVFPYLIKEDTKKVYINIANLNKIQEVEATVLYRFEYNVRLEQIVEMKCTDCIHYNEDIEEDNLEGHRGKISLDGKCSWYQKKDD
ncbi:MAG: hypothetical protein E7679_05130 [Ruminococcaceae bacterium]|nr:hypothetical protein [Oscillospiraceae bacterium]